jgi:hypothetical protein
MAEAAAAATGAPSTSGGAPPAAPSTGVVPNAGATLTAVPTGSPQAQQWINEFKSDDLKSFVQERKFTSVEQMAERYKNLESLKGVPDDRLLIVPKNWDSPEASAMWEKLGRPKDPKGYEFTEKPADPTFLKWAEDSFIKNNVVKSQAQGLLKSYNEFMTKSLAESATARANAIKQADEKLRGEWGAKYDENLKIAQTGARALGLDAKTLDVIEALQGREGLFKTLKEIGVRVGEAPFVDAGGPPKELTPEEARAQIQDLMKDEKFYKKLTRGDVEAREKWDRLNKAAAPGERQIG